jgi:anti-sigma regulatory factor (Ser/Thr protein kinase)
MGEIRREIIVDATTADLPLVLEFVEAACTAAGIRDDVRFDLQLAAEEACANIIEHAYGDEGGAIQLSFATQEKDVILTVVDHGPPFDPGSVNSPDLSTPLEERRIGGLGVYLIRTLVDELIYTLTEEGNVVQMVRRDVVGGQAHA